MQNEIKTHLQDFIDKLEPKIKKIDGPDYYVSQSKIHTNPELLIVGINPAGNKKLSESSFPSKTAENLIYTSQQYLENPDWNISKRLNIMFSGQNARRAYKEAVIINYIAINTPKESDLNKDEYKELTTICKEFSNDLIYNIIKPKKVLILGPSLAKMMKINFHHRDDSILRTSDDKSYLVLNFDHRGIPHYLIYHPSTPELNGNEHLSLKMEYFEKLFTK